MTQEHQDRRGADKEVLLIEENLRDANFIRRLLLRNADNFYRVTHVRSLRDALNCGRDLDLAVIVSDLNLPDSRGFETVEKLEAAFHGTPLIIVSDWEDEAVSLRALHAGAQDYIVKGQINAATLHRALRYAMERKRAEIEMARLAHYDQLTGLANRKLYRETMEQAIERANSQEQKLATFIVGLDRFKEINDSLGHESGDRYLIEIAKRLKQNVHEPHTIARLGGDEFGVLIEDVTDVGDVLTTVRRILEALSSPVIHDDHEIRGSASIGISLYPDNGASTSDLLRAADLAMHQAKTAGRNNYQFFADSMQKEAESRHAKEWALRRAAEREEFELVYQPLVCLRSGATIGLEALLRWWGPSGGLLTPYHFIDILEETGLIVSVGNWVLHSACEQMQRWHEAGFEDLRISVNVSAKQFEDAHFIDHLKSALKESSLSPKYLELELTESLLMEDASETIKLLEEIRALGVRIAVDDFGTGYSSLAYLNEFPLHTLKIDRTFVQSVEEEGKGGAISNLIIGLGTSLNLEVVAEGIETEAQLAFLRSRGCDIGQGYLFTRPLNVTKIEQWLESRSRMSGAFSRLELQDDAKSAP